MQARATAAVAGALALLCIVVDPPGPIPACPPRTAILVLEPAVRSIRRLGFDPPVVRRFHFALVAEEICADLESREHAFGIQRRRKGSPKPRR
jgi:hypothetical protein